MTETTPTMRQALGPEWEKKQRSPRRHAACTLVWEVRLIRWDVCYGAEFVPGFEGRYTVIIQKSRKIVPADETVVFGSFKIGENGKVVLTFNNQTSKKKKCR
ncbi:unnamed protein product [Camellia sinensis]